jgi:hypothetical protein
LPDLPSSAKLLFMTIAHFYCSALRDGYESDSSLLIRKRDDVTSPRNQTPDEAKSDYNRIQKGGEVPRYGLRMSAPEKKGTLQTSYERIAC